MKNLDNIFPRPIVSLGTKFDHVFSLEVQGVSQGIKKIAKLEPFTRKDVETLSNILSDVGLKYIFFEKEEVFDERSMRFSQHSKASEYVDIYVSKSQFTLDTLTEILLSSKSILEKNFITGKLLGYPECCIRSFLKQSYPGDVQMNLNIKNKTKGKFDWRLNNLVNPYSLIPFFPCSYNCERAIEYADRNLEILGVKEELQKYFAQYVLYRDFWDIELSEENMFQEAERVFNFSM